jgi:hypothetical protein
MFVPTGLMSNAAPNEPQPPSEFERELLKEEYFFLQNAIEDYNKQIWAIKALGISGTGAVIALTVQLKLGTVAYLGCAIPLFFWLLESQWKHFQRGFYPRVVEIERILIEEWKFRTPAIYKGWTSTFKRKPIAKRKGYLWDGLLNPSVFVSYALAIAFLVFLGAIAPAILN